MNPTTMKTVMMMMMMRAIVMDKKTVVKTWKMGTVKIE